MCCVGSFNCCVCVACPEVKSNKSSARVRAIVPMDRISSIHGLMSSATSVMLRGHPCGMPLWCECALPRPNASVLYIVRFSWYFIYVCKMGGGMPATAAMWYISGHSNWSKHLKISVALPEKSVLCSRQCSTWKEVSYHASSAPKPSIPANMPSNCQLRIQFRRLCSLVLAHLRYRTGRMSRTRYASGLCMSSGSLDRYAARPLVTSSGHAAPASTMFRSVVIHQYVLYDKRVNS